MTKKTANPLSAEDILISEFMELKWHPVADTHCAIRQTSYNVKFKTYAACLKDCEKINKHKKAGEFKAYPWPCRNNGSSIDINYNAWENMMPVIEKIAKLNHDVSIHSVIESKRGVKTAKMVCAISDWPNSFDVYNTSLLNMIIPTRQSVLEFIKVYNEENGKKKRK